MANTLGLQELIERARDELVALSDKVKSSETQPTLRVAGLEIEVQFVAVESRESKGGFDLKVVTAGAGKAYEKQQLHKVTVRLEPLSGRTPSEPTIPLLKYGFGEPGKGVVEKSQGIQVHGLAPGFYEAAPGEDDRPPLVAETGE